MQDLWHYPRSEDAERIVATLGVGLVSAIAIIEPRRRGKTTFLQEDLAPAASRQGIVPIYINLAATTGEVEPLIVASIGDIIDAQARVGIRLRGLRSAKLKKLSGKASVATGEIGAELEFEQNQAGAGPLTAAFRDLLRLKTPVLFMLDEVHRLADAQQSRVAWSLRSLLDTHRNVMKVVATSSSAASYEVMVTGEKKAFNRWFTRIPLGPLDQRFSAHLAKIVKTHFPKHAITADEIAEAFEALGNSPKFVRDYLSQRIMNPHVDHRSGLEDTEIAAAKDSGFNDEFERLNPLHRIILVALGTNATELFSAAALVAFGRALGTEAVSKTLVQRGIKSLADKGWVIKQDRGDYKLADALFEHWLQAQIKRGLLPSPAQQRGAA